jgi:hypothetical protein
MKRIDAGSVVKGTNEMIVHVDLEGGTQMLLMPQEALLPPVIHR